MKYLFLIIFSLAYCVKTKAQAGSNNDLLKMIDSAITIKCSRVSDTGNFFSNLYLLNEQDQPLDFLPSFKKFGFKSIRIYDQQSKKTLKKGINAWKVLTILNGNKLEIRIIDFLITYKDKNYNFSNGGGAIVIFEFSCNEQVWKLISSQDRGI